MATVPFVTWLALKITDSPASLCVANGETKLRSQPAASTSMQAGPVPGFSQLSVPLAVMVSMPLGTALSVAEADPLVTVACVLAELPPPAPVTCTVRVAPLAMSVVATPIEMPSRVR